MRAPSRYDDERSRLDVKMTPLIDVVFLLLIFFVWTSSFHVLEFILPSSVSVASPQSATPDVLPPEKDFDSIVIRLLWQDGRPMWTVNDTPAADLGDVRRTLLSIAQIDRQIPIIIDPSEEVPLGHVIDLYDISRQFEFEKVQFAASEDL